MNSFLEILITIIGVLLTGFIAYLLIDHDPYG